MQSPDKRTAGSSRLRARRGSKSSHTTTATAATTAHAHGHAHTRGASQRRRRACCSGRVVVLCMLAAVCVGLLSRWLLLHALPPTTDTPTVYDTATLRHALTQAQHSLHTHIQQQQQQQQQQQSTHHIGDSNMQHATRSLWRTLEHLAAAMLRVAGALDVYLQQQANKVGSDGVTYDDSGAAQLDATTVAAAELLHEAATLCYHVVHDTHTPPLLLHHVQQQQQQHDNVTHARTSDQQQSLPPPPYALAWQRVWAAAAFAYGTALPEYHLLRDEVDEHVRVLLRLVHVLLLSTDCRDDDGNDVGKHSSNTTISSSSSINGAHNGRSASWWVWLLHVLHLRRDHASAPPHVHAHCRLLAGNGEHDGSSNNNNNDDDSNNNATQLMRHHGNDAAAMTWQRFCASSLHSCVAVDTRIAAALEELIALRPRTHAFRAHYAAHYVLRYARARLASRDDGAHDTHARRQAAATALRLLRSDRTRLHNSSNTTRTTTTAQARASASRTRDDVAVHRGLLDLLEAYVLVAVADAALTRVLHDNTTDAQHWRRSVVALITRAARTLGDCTRLTHATRHIHSHHSKSKSSNDDDNDDGDDDRDMAAVLYWPSAAAEDADSVWRREWQPPLFTSRAATQQLGRVLYRFVAQYANDDADVRTMTLAFLRSCVVS